MLTFLRTISIEHNGKEDIKLNKIIIEIEKFSADCTDDVLTLCI